MLSLASLPRTGALLCAMLALPAQADNAPTPQPVITVSAGATRSVPNDRMRASLRAEAEDPDATKAANAVNARMAAALARAKAAPGVEVSTSGYTTYSTGDPRQGPLRWRVVQSLDVSGSDFVALAGLVSRLQAEDGLLVSGMGFSLSPTALRAAEDALVQQAIRTWQQRAQVAVRAFGSTTWRPGRVTVQTSEPGGGPQPLMRAQAMSATQAISTEAGDTEVTVTVSGEAVLPESQSLR